MPLFTQAPATICVLRLSAIGDVCNAIAAVQAIEKYWPTTQVTWIAGKAEAALLAPLLPNVRVIAFDKNQGFTGMRAIWRALSSTHFDALLHMQTALRASLLSLGIKARHRLGFAKDRSSDLQHLFINHYVPSPSSQHVLDGFMAFSHALGVPQAPPSWDLQLGESDLAWAKQQLCDKPTLLVAPASSKAFKNWHAQGYADVINHAQQQGFAVILAGGPSQMDVTLGEQIMQKLTLPAHNLIGKTTLLQMLALIKQVQLVLSPDSGPAHLANALGTPVIGLYAHHDPQRTGPYHWRHLVISAYEQALFAQTQKSVAEVAWRTRIKDNNAMNLITKEAVIARFDAVITQLGLRQ